MFAAELTAEAVLMADAAVAVAVAAVEEAAAVAEPVAPQTAAEFLEAPKLTVLPSEVPSEQTEGRDELFTFSAFLNL